MKRILLSALAFGAMTTAAMAEPQKMTEEQMGDVAAGLAGLDLTVISNEATLTNEVTSLALALGGGSATSTAAAEMTFEQDVDVNQDGGWPNGVASALTHKFTNSSFPGH